MGWLIKHNLSGHYVRGKDKDDYHIFSGNFDTAWWWETEEDAQWYMEENDLSDVSAFDSGGSNPPGDGQPGKP